VTRRGRIGRAVAALLMLVGVGVSVVRAMPAPGDTPSVPPPSDAVVLFDGKDLSAWARRGSGAPATWKVENGVMTAGGGDIVTKQAFRDFQLHVEFRTPNMPDARGQGKGNSGVYLQGSYEIQVLDSYGLTPRNDDCGAIYGQAPPRVNACRPPEVWQSYDILFHAPRFDSEGKQIARARVSVLQNGIWIHDNVEITGPTTASMPRDVREPGPIMLQDHGNPVQYRNIWIRPLGS
jgi:hypothetical protein